MPGLEIANVNPGEVTIEFMVSLLQTLGHDELNEGWDVGFSYLKGLYVAEMREDLCERLVESDREWLLFVDSDIEWQPGDVLALLGCADADDRPVVSGVYVAHFYDRVGPVAWTDKAQGEPIEWQQGGLLEAESVGAGFLLIHRSVIEKVQEAYGSAFASFREDGVTWGEDTVFCKRVRELGIPIFVNAEVRLGHAKTVTLEPLD